MENGPDHYFNTATALSIWRENNQTEEKIMFARMAEQKGMFFSRVIFKTSLLPEHLLQGMAEDAFTDVWMGMRTKAQNGQLIIDQADYRGYFYAAFKNTYLKKIEKELRQVAAQKELALQHKEDVFTLPEQTAPDDFSQKTRATLNQMGEGCRELLTMRFVEKMKIEEIAHAMKGKLNRGSVIKVLSRCKKRFKEKWESKTPSAQTPPPPKGGTIT